MKSAIAKTIKFSAGVCAALGIVTLGAVVASGTAVKVVAEGLKAGAAAMKKTMAELRAEQVNNETAGSATETVDSSVADLEENIDNDDPAENLEGEL